MIGGSSFRRSVTVLVALIGLAAALVAPSSPVGADPTANTSEKLRGAVTVENLKAHLDAFADIAADAGGNRFAGLPGYTNSAEYVIDQLEAAGYEPYVHTFTYNAFIEEQPSELHQVSPNATIYVNGVDFRIMSYSGSGDVTAALAAPTGAATGCVAGDFAGFPAGSIALVQRGTCTFRVKTTNAQAAGASAILIYNNIAGVLNGTLGEAPVAGVIPSLGLTQSLGQSLLALMGSGRVTMHVETVTDARPLETYNVLAELPGRSGDTNVVMAGAHLDSVSAGPGINDNGSGSAAILEVAIQLARGKVEPRNTVRFAWWSAEESGLVGSTRYVAALKAAGTLDDVALYLNFDMVASPNFVRFVYDGDNSLGTGSVGPPGSAEIERLFASYFSSQGLASEPTPFNGRSDYGPFIAEGIPAGGLFTGAEGIKTAAQASVYGGTAGVAYDPCYHAVCDTTANISDTGFDQMADAVAHAVLTYAQNTSDINDAKGKGNFKPKAPAPVATVGGGDSGGLHDHEAVPL